MVFVLFILFASCFRDIMVKLHMMSPFEDPKINEELGTYFDCVPNFARRAAYAEESYKRGKLNIRTMDDKTYEALRNTQGKKKLIEGPCSYNLQMDLRYIEGFCYDPVQDRDTPEEEILSDLITEMCFLGYTRENDMTKLFEDTCGAILKARTAKKLKGQNRNLSKNAK